MPDKPISPPRQRMIDDMRARRFKEKVQKDYVRHVRTFAAFLGRSPDTATSEDLRRFQLHLAQQQISAGSINAAIAALRFFFTVTLERPDLVRPLRIVNEPRKAPVVLSQDEVARLLEAAPGLKYKAAPLDDKGVTFKWKDYRIEGRDRLRTMTLDAAEFIRRFLTHVLPSGLHRIRHYGLFAGAARADNIERARQLLAAARAAPQRPCTEADSQAEDVSPARRCPCCGGRMIIVETFEGPRPWRSPSPNRIRIDSS